MSLREIIIPEDKKYFKLFTLQAKNIQLASQKLLAAFSTGDLSIEQARKEIRQIEHENDQIVRSIYDRLNTSFINPMQSSQGVLQLLWICRKPGDAEPICLCRKADVVQVD